MGRRFLVSDKGRDVGLQEKCREIGPGENGTFGPTESAKLDYEALFNADNLIVLRGGSAA